MFSHNYKYGCVFTEGEVSRTISGSDVLRHHKHQLPTKKVVLPRQFFTKRVILLKVMSTKEGIILGNRQVQTYFVIMQTKYPPKNGVILPQSDDRLFGIMQIKYPKKEFLTLDHIRFRNVLSLYKPSIDKRRSCLVPDDVQASSSLNDPIHFISNTLAIRGERGPYDYRQMYVFHAKYILHIQNKIIPS